LLTTLLVETIWCTRFVINIHQSGEKHVFSTNFSH